MMCPAVVRPEDVQAFVDLSDQFRILEPCQFASLGFVRWGGTHGSQNPDYLCRFDLPIDVAMTPSPPFPAVVLKPLVAGLPVQPPVTDLKEGQANVNECL